MQALAVAAPVVAAPVVTAMKPQQGSRVAGRARQERSAALARQHAARQGQVTRRCRRDRRHRD
eukprot:5141168-Prymnesium_polylepis.1